MDVQGDKPTHAPCGHCGASTALSWSPMGFGSWQGQGRCSSCGWLVCSLLFDEASAPTFSEVQALLSRARRSPRASAGGRRS